MHARCSVQIDAPFSQLDRKSRGMRSLFLPALNRFIGNKPRITAAAKVGSARVRPAGDVAFILIRNAKRKPVESIDAYDCFLRGSALFEERTREAYEKARVFFERAIELDPSFSTPYSMVVRCYSTAKLHGWATDPVHAEAEVRRLAEIVSALGADDALALSITGFGLAWVCRDFEVGAAFTERAPAEKVQREIRYMWPKCIVEVSR